MLTTSIKTTVGRFQGDSLVHCWEMSALWNHSSMEQQFLDKHLHAEGNLEKTACPQEGKKTGKKRDINCYEHCQTEVGHQTGEQSVAGRNNQWWFYHRSKEILVVYQEQAPRITRCLSTEKPGWLPPKWMDLIERTEDTLLCCCTGSFFSRFTRVLPQSTRLQSPQPASQYSPLHEYQDHVYSFNVRLVILFVIIVLIMPRAPTMAAF